MLQRRHAGPAEPDLAQHLADLVAQRVVEALGDAQHALVEAHAGLNDQRQKVGRFGERALDLAATPPDELLEPQAGRDESQHS